MEITIRRLIPQLTEDFLHFFDITPHSERPDDDDCKCYCVWWCGECQDGAVFENHLCTKEKRREYARIKIAEGKIQGYLAYHGEQVTGWCNANEKSACYPSFCWSHFMGQVQRETSAERIRSILCFAVAPDFRGKGVASKLLRQICEDAAKEGVDWVEAYPNDAFQDQAKDFMGPLGLYAGHGFSEAYRIDQKIVMRKRL